MDAWMVTWVEYSGAAGWHIFDTEREAREAMGEALEIARPGSVRVRPVEDPAAWIGGDA